MELSQPVYNLLDTGKSRLFAAAIVCSFSLFWAAFWTPYLLAGLLGALFVAVFISSRTFRWLVFPTVLILNQYILLNSGISFLFVGLFIQPVDWVALLLITTVLFKKAFTGERVWVQTGLELPIWIFLGAIAIGLFKAPDLKAGMVNWGHQVLFFVTFYAMVADWKDVAQERIWKVYFLWAVAAAASALWQFFISGGGRSLGFARMALNALVLPVLCFELARLSLMKNPKRWVLVVAFVVAAVASQTRGLWLSIGVLLAVWLFSGCFLKPFKLIAARRVVSKFVTLIFLLLLVFFLLAPFLGQAERRAVQLGQQSGTVYLRFFLWGLAWQLFWAHPVTGIGMGQFAAVVERFPEMKNLAIFEWTRGLSAHNLTLTFLAETGLVGTIAFLALLISIVRLAWKAVRKTRTLEALSLAWGFFLLFLVLAISLLFAGVWNYEVAFFMALLVLFARKLETPLERTNAS